MLLALHLFDFARNIYSTSSYIMRTISCLPKEALDRKTAIEKYNYRSSGIGMVRKNIKQIWIKSVGFTPANTEKVIYECGPETHWSRRFWLIGCEYTHERSPMYVNPLSISANKSAELSAKQVIILNNLSCHTPNSLTGKIINSCSTFKTLRDSRCSLIIFNRNI